MADKEYTLSTDSFNSPIELSGAKAKALNIMRLFLMEPGTNTSRPEMGVGKGQFRYMLDDELDDLKTKLDEQINDYLPEYRLQSINLQIKDGNTLQIDIKTYDGYFSFSMDTDTKIITLDNLNSEG